MKYFQPKKHIPHKMTQHRDLRSIVSLQRIKKIPHLLVTKLANENLTPFRES